MKTIQTEGKRRSFLFEIVWRLSRVHPVRADSDEYKTTVSKGARSFRFRRCVDLERI